MEDLLAPAVSAFREQAAGFCNWCEGESLGERPDVLAAVWLARMHAAALLLPETEPENEEGSPKLPAAQLAAAERNLAPFAGWFYRTVFDPDPSSTEGPLMGDVGDDLLDTYKDIKAGCVLYDQAQVLDALWHWSFMHRIHWGKHVVGALAALHGAARTDGSDPA